MSIQGTKALQVWSQKVTKEYTNVNIVNMTTSWRNGLGFCAIIHHYCPHLIEYHNLNPDDVFENNNLAFTTAEKHFGIPVLLDPLDMVKCELLDKVSIITYLAQLYKALNPNNIESVYLPPMEENSSTTSACEKMEQIQRVSNHDKDFVIGQGNNFSVPQTSVNDRCEDGDDIDKAQDVTTDVAHSQVVEVKHFK